MKIDTHFGNLTVERAIVKTVLIDIDAQSVDLTIWFFVENGTEPIYEKKVTIPFDKASKEAQAIYGNVKQLTDEYLKQYIAALPD